MPKVQNDYDGDIRHYIVHNAIRWAIVNDPSISNKQILRSLDHNAPGWRSLLRTDTKETINRIKRTYNPANSMTSDSQRRAFNWLNLMISESNWRAKK